MLCSLHPSNQMQTTQTQNSGTSKWGLISYQQLSVAQQDWIKIDLYLPLITYSDHLGYISDDIQPQEAINK